MRWFQRKHKRVSSSHTRSDTQTKHKATNGTYKTPGKMWADDGGDEAAWQGVLRLIAYNTKCHKEGKLWKGEPYIVHDEQKGVLKLLELERVVTDSNSEQWANIKTWNDPEN